MERDGTVSVQAGQVGQESAFLTDTGFSGTVHGYSRSGTIVARVVVDDAGEDPADAHAVLAATIERLQQVQAGRPATATVSGITAAEETRPGISP
ncbi:hypothetical protein ACFVU3_21500 [Streptomyces sp. NPDC058052]|uniref:hypothetical protein n=1 Tax=Streptomyces sp. NPDC058052 TaxID=3346316 RepID=UPI0036EFD346